MRVMALKFVFPNVERTGEDVWENFPFSMTICLCLLTVSQNTLEGEQDSRRSTFRLLPALQSLESCYSHASLV